MENTIRMERNRKSKIRITEIPPGGEFETIECPFCKFSLQMGVVKEGSLNGATVYCRKCKRKLRIDG